MLGTPTVWLVAAGITAAGLFAGGVAIRHNAQVTAARETGEATGAGKAATAALDAATKTAEAERQAAEEVGTVTDKAAIIELCKRSASCRERRTLK
jgi:hypothetical protein